MQGLVRERLVRRWPLVGRAVQTKEFDEVLADRRRTGFFIYGHAGVGKSRLAEECLEKAEEKGHATRRAVATVAAASVPLGAIAHLLPNGIGLSDPVAGFAAVAEALRESRPRGGRTVILIDDVHLLDATSAMLLRQLMDAGLVFLIGSVRSGEACNDVVAALTGGDTAHRVDLCDLPLHCVRELLERVLGGTVGSRAANLVHASSGGNPLFLRELVTGAAEAGTLAHDGELWEITECRFSTTRRLTDLIRLRLSSASTAGRRVLDTLALCEPLSPALLAGEGDLQAAEELEEAGFVVVVPEQRRSTMRLAHPLYGEVLREQMPEVRRRETLLRHVAVLERCGARRRDDALHLARYRLAATGTADPALLAQAAALAVHAAEYTQALFLLRALSEEQHGVGTRLLMGKALFETGDFDHAEAVLAMADAVAEGEREVVPVTLVRTQNLVWGLGSSSERVWEVLGAARRRVGSPSGRFALTVNEAMCALAVGDFARSRALCESLDLDDPGAVDVQTRFIAAITKSAALSAFGAAQEALAWAERARDVMSAAESNGSPLGMHEALHQYQSIRVLALTEDGRLNEARSVAEGIHAALAREPVSAPTSHRLLEFHLARAQWFAGHPGSARRWYAQVAYASRPHTANPLSMALAGLAASAALQGDVEAAEKAWTERCRLGTAVRLPEEMLGEAWLCVARGELTRARTILGSAAREARERHQISFEAILLTDLTRLGGAREAAGRLREIAETGDNRFHKARSDLATAWAAEDPEGLLVVGDRLETMGADLLAAEACATAAKLLRANGSGRPSRAAAIRARNLAARCEGARTPALLITEAGASLTKREQEIALLAARGLLSKDIAARLTLSVRTVDNHLQRIYGKMGITTRQELAAHLDRAP
ncbi:LuxR C-terminal-related transcriptional regulator [Streptomyces sp. NPDC049597]|uniref:ATP-binding protein n=1 Tax=Streptomyces sp. NPDC049597 TaxID=3155276 RepID=UPI00343E1FB3